MYLVKTKKAPADAGAFHVMQQDRELNELLYVACDA